MTTTLCFTCDKASTLAYAVEFLRRCGFALSTQGVQVELSLAKEVKVNPPSTVNQWVIHYLQQGPASTKEIWAFLQGQNKAPSTTTNLAPYLSRLKKAGLIQRYGKLLWCLTVKT